MEVLIGIVSVLLIYNQVITWMFQNWILNPYMNYGLLVPFISGYLIWKERKHFKVSVDRRGLVLLGLAALLYLAPSFTLRAVSLVLFVSGSFLLLFGKDATRRIVFPLAFLLLMIPLPDFMIEYVGLHLRNVSVNLAFGLVDIVYDIQIINDTYIQAGDLTFYVGLPCSGIESFLGFGVFALLFAYLFEKGWKRPGLIVVCLGLTIAMNIFRIFLVVVVGIWFGEEAAMGVFHTLSGMVLISIYTIILLFVYRRRL
jgi:exosortase